MRLICMFNIDVSVCIGVSIDVDGLLVARTLYSGYLFPISSASCIDTTHVIAI